MDINTFERMAQDKRLVRDGEIINAFWKWRNASEYENIKALEALQDFRSKSVLTTIYFQAAQA